MAGRLPTVTGRQLLRALARDGWYVSRTTRHHILSHPTKPGSVPVRKHPSADIDEGTPRRILKSTGLTAEQLASCSERRSAMRYSVVLVPGSRPGRYVAYVPTIPGCVTQGDSFEEALEMAQDAAAAMLADMAEHGEELPTEATGAMVASIDVALPVCEEAIA